MPNDGYVIEFINECTLFVPHGQTILEACVAAEIPLFHACGGKAKCSTCRVLIIAGAEHLSSPNSKEQRLQQLMSFPPSVRLGCQTEIAGSAVKLKRIIQDETDVHIYIGEEASYSTEQMGEEKELILFFLDIRSFTQFVETHLAFDIVHIIRKLFSVFQTILQKHKGKIIETTGDGFYAVFECGEDRKRSVKEAVQSGYAIISALEELNANYFKTYFSQVIQIGIGMHIGKVIRGAIQLNGEKHIIVMGLPVNVASRLQNATKEVNNSFLVSADLYSNLDNMTLPHKHTLLQLKGVSAAVTAYHLGKSYT